MRIGHDSPDGNRISVSAAIHAHLAELTIRVDELLAQVDHLHDNNGHVWVEALLAARLFLDAQNRALIDRAHEMTTRYLERTITSCARS